MTQEELDILIAKGLAGEASPEEQTQLQSLLQASAVRRAEFDQLSLVWASLKEAGPCIQAMEAPAREIPEGCLLELQQVVRACLPESETWVAGEVNRETAANRRQPEARPRGRFQEWLEGHWQRRLAVGAALVAAFSLILGGFVWLRPAREARSADSAKLGAPVAYLVVTEGEVALLHRDSSRVVPAIAALKPGDRVDLPRGGKAEVITSNGAVQVQGPREINTREIQQLGQPDAIRSTQGARATVAALFGPAADLGASSLLVAMRGGAQIPVYSPIGATKYSGPDIWWKAEPGKLYDLAITDEFHPEAKPFQIQGVKPPVRFNEAWPGRQLEKDGLFRLRIVESGGRLPPSEYTFRTLNRLDDPLPAKPSEELMEAYRTLVTEPARTGDALRLLRSLPPDLESSELALRLQLLAYGRLGYQEDFDSVLAKLKLRQIPVR